MAMEKVQVVRGDMCAFGMWQETEEGNKKINALQKQHDSALDEFDNNSLQVETQKEFIKHINPNPPKPNLMGITEARNENES